MFNLKKDIGVGSLSCQLLTLPFRSLGSTNISWRLSFNRVLAGTHLHQHEVTNKNSDGCIQAMTCGSVTAVRAVSGLCIQVFHLYSNNLRTDWKRDVCNCVRLQGFPLISVWEKGNCGISSYTTHAGCIAKPSEKAHLQIFLFLFGSLLNNVASH